MEQLSGSRVTVARQRRGLTKKELASLIGVSTRSLQSWESGAAEPQTEHVEAMAMSLHFPTSFFFAHELENLDTETASFRSMKSMKARHRDMALSAGSLCIEISTWIDSNFQLPALNLPDLRGMDPEAAASDLRQIWGLGIRPIRNMVHLLELHGVRVFSLVQDAVEVDAFSFRKSERAYVVLNMNKSAERGRFDAAHELGHLVLHQHGAPNGRLAEQEADLFASSFLMPRESVIANAPRLPTRENLIALKRIWKVSVRALVTRLYKLNLVSEWHYRKFFRDNPDTRTVEPNSIERERSQVLPRIFGAIASDGMSKVDVAKTLHLQVSELEALVFGLVPVSGSGFGKTRRWRSTNIRLV